MPSWSLLELFCSMSWSMGWSFNCRHHHVLLLAVFKHWSLIPSFWLVWHISMLLSGSILQSKAHVWGVEVLVCEDLRYLLKYGCEGGTLLWRRLSTSTSSRVARFDDIFHFGLWMYHFHVYVWGQLSKCNVIAFTLHLRGVLEYNS